MQSVNEWLEENAILELECLVPDITGNARGKIIPAHTFGGEQTRLPEAVLLQDITGGYTDEIDQILGATDSDMFLKPVTDTLRRVPWASKPTGQMIHDCYNRDGKLHELSSRAVLKKVLALFAAEGWTPVVAPEVEFYLVKKTDDANPEVEPATGRSENNGHLRHSYTINAISEFEAVIDDIFVYSKAQGLDTECLIDETGAGQFEMNFVHGDALALADQVFLFKRSVREAALKHGLSATFMAKPMRQQPGSAMHIHQSIVDSNSGKNIFVNEGGSENARFRHYIGGLQQYTPQAFSLYAPNVNSYRRFTKHIAAPINLHWGYDNRTTGLRVPDSSAQAKRVENRFSGVDANPYLAIAATLACGYLGIKHAIEPDEPCDGDAFEQEIGVPRTLEHALSQLEDSLELRDIFGTHFVDGYVAVKREELEHYNRCISPWEREFLLTTV